MIIEGKGFLLAVLRRFYGPDEPNPVRRAVLDSTYFLHPDVVAQTRGLPIVRARRMATGERKNTVAADGDLVSDNFHPNYVFRAAMEETRDQGSTQLSHIYGGKGEARDTFFYTNLANLCLMPSFLAKLADTDPPTVTVLKQCAFVLYGFDPRGDVAGSRIEGDLRMGIKIATPPASPLHVALSRLKDANFLKAKAAGYLFREDGSINEGSDWILSMLARSTGQPVHPPPSDYDRIAKAELAVERAPVGESVGGGNWDSNSQTWKPLVRPETQEKARRARELRDSGNSIDAIARVMNLSSARIRELLRP